MQLVSWNVNGLRAIARKGFGEWLETVRPDILCLQETRAEPTQLPPEIRQPDAYHAAFVSGERKGYSGVATFSRRPPLRQATGFGLDPRFDAEGRILLSEYERFVLLNIYFPNGAASEARLAYKMDFYEATLRFCRTLEQAGKPLIICGDVNTAHTEIDLARPKENEAISGFLPEERAWLDRFLAAGYIDAFRRLHPDRCDAYTWWSFRAASRRRNVGWRIDYFFVSEALWPAVSAAGIHADVAGSDHCPISLTLAL
jgi:exodeoxyribonuclease III